MALYFPAHVTLIISDEELCVVEVMEDISDWLEIIVKSSCSQCSTVLKLRCFDSVVNGVILSLFISYYQTIMLLVSLCGFIE